MTRVAWLLVAACAVLAPAADAQKKGRGGKDKGGDPAAVVEGKLGTALDEYLSSAARFPAGFSGSVLVAKDGKALLLKGYGVADAKQGTPIRADSLWDWCSVTKQWTAAAVLRLEMQKKLDVDDPLPKVLEDVPKDKARVTLRHLMNHTSGIVAGGDGFGAAESSDREALIRWVLRQPVASEPGEKFEYSNAAYFLLAAIIEKKSGKTWERAVRELLFEPAGMKEARCIGDPDLELARVPLDARGTGVAFAYGNELSWGYRGAGGIVAPVGDLLAWDRALRGKKLLSAAAKEKLYEVGQNDYALGWEVRNDGGSTIYSHSGHTGKVVTFYLRSVDPDVVIALAQSEEPATHPAVVARELLQLVRGPGGRSAR